MLTLREAREAKVLSQGELAKSAGVAKSTVIDIEAGRATPHPRTRRKLAEALGLPALEIAWPNASTVGRGRNGLASGPS